jgi:hypothetical protein
VFLTSWRQGAATRLSLRAAAGTRTNHVASDETQGGIADYKSRTQRIAFLAGTTIGVVIAALGIRSLELLVDPAVFSALPEAQRRLFNVADVLLTGAILGGGADGLHKLVSAFTNFVDSTAQQAKNRVTTK